jgi:hypothetical protein
MLASLALISLLQAPTFGAGDLSLTNARFTHGLLGPARADAKAHPGDSLFLSFNIDGIAVDDSGKVSYGTAVEVSDSKGKVIFQQAPHKFVEFLPLGGDTVPAFANINLAADSPAGEYTMKVVVTDGASNKSKSLSQKFEVLPKAFDLVRIAFTGDGDGLVPVGSYCVGQQVWFHAAVVGFERSAQKQPKVSLQLRVLDETGKPVVAKPFAGTVDKDVPANATTLPVRFSVPLNRAGKYTVEVTANDDLKKSTVSKKFPISVHPSN